METPKPSFPVKMLDNVYISLSHWGNLHITELVETEDVMFLQREDVYIDHTQETALCMQEIYS